MLSAMSETDYAQLDSHVLVMLDGIPRVFPFAVGYCDVSGLVGLLVGLLVGWLLAWLTLLLLVQARANKYAIHWS